MTNKILTPDELFTRCKELLSSISKTAERFRIFLHTADFEESAKVNWVRVSVLDGIEGVDEELGNLLDWIQAKEEAS